MIGNITGTFRAWWAAILSVALGGLATLLPAESLSEASEEIVTFVSIIAAGATTAMALSATVLRGSAISVLRIRKFSAALEAQFGLWFILVAACVISAFSTVVAQILGWSIVTLRLSLSGIDFAVDIIYLLIFVIAASTSFAFFKIGQFLLGLRRLLRINNEIAFEEAKGAAIAELEEVEAESPKPPSRPGFGRVLGEDD